MIFKGIRRGLSLTIVNGIILLAALSLNGGGNIALLSGDTINGSIAYGPAMWNRSNFPALIMEETLNVNDISNRTIMQNNLTYSTSAVPVKLDVVTYGLGMNDSTWNPYIAANNGLEQAGDGQAFGGGNYYIAGWQGQKYVALNGKIDKLTYLIIEHDPSETMNLAVGETWNMGEGWELTVNSIDSSALPVQAKITLSKNGIVKDNNIITDTKPIYTFVETSLAGEANVPVFVTYADNITSDTVQFKYTWLISSNVTLISSGDIYGVFRDAAVTNAGKTLTMKNSDVSIILYPGSTTLLMDSLYLVAVDSPYLEYYPMMTLTPPPMNQPPVAKLIYSPMYPVVNQIITFDASFSYDPDGYITGYLWNINGNIFTSEIVNISFPSPGFYPADLTVTDNNGAMSSANTWIYVTEPPPIPPANDDFDSATVISTLPFIDSINTINATNAWDDPYSWCAYWYSHTVWYSFTPAENMRIVVDPSGTDYSPVLLSAYGGSRGALYNIGCNLIYTSPDYPSQPLVVYVYANQTVYFMVGSYDSNPGGNLKLKVDVLPALAISLNIDPDGSVNRLTGDAMIHGTVTCSRPASGSMSINLSQRAGRFNVIRGSSNLQYSCGISNSTTTAWNATVRGSNGPFNAGQVSVEAFASAYDWLFYDYATDDASVVVHLKGKER